MRPPSLVQLLFILLIFTENVYSQNHCPQHWTLLRARTFNPQVDNKIYSALLDEGQQIPLLDERVEITADKKSCYCDYGLEVEATRNAGQEIITTTLRFDSLVKFHWFPQVDDPEKCIAFNQKYPAGFADFVNLGTDNHWTRFGPDEVSLVWMKVRRKKYPMGLLERGIDFDQNELRITETDTPGYASLLQESISRECNIQELVINSGGDNDLDPNAPLGVCTTGGVVMVDGEEQPECTLRAAIEMVNKQAKNELIVFKFALPITNPEIRLENSLPVLNHSLGLDGSTQTGALVTIIGKSNLSGINSSGSNIKTEFNNLYFKGFDDALIYSGGSHTLDSLVFTNNRNPVNSYNVSRLTIKNSLFGHNFEESISASETDLVIIRENYFGWIEEATPNGEAAILLDDINNASLTDNIITESLNEGIIAKNVDNLNIQNNIIGSGPEGHKVDGIKEIGVKISDSQDIDIAQNVIVNCDKNAIMVDDFDSIALIGNHIGIFQGNPSLIASNGSGISLKEYSRATINDNTISDSKVGSGIDLNVPSQNSITKIMSNKIGTDPTGTIDKGNSGHGIIIQGGSSDIVSEIEIQHNTISGNHENGIFIVTPKPYPKFFGLFVNISNNIIGLDASGNERIGNSRNGIVVSSNATLTIQSNTISDNHSGVFIISAPFTIKGNKIGTDITGTKARENKILGLNILDANGTVLENNLLSSTKSIGMAAINGNVNFQSNTVGDITNVLDRTFKEGITLNRGIYTFSDNTIVGCNIAVKVSAETKVELDRNTIFYNEVGLQIEGVDNQLPLITEVYGNRICYNTTGLITRNIPFNFGLNDLCNNTGTNSGLHLETSKATVFGNQFFGDKGDAIFLDPLSDANIIKNNFKSNEGFAINNQNSSVHLSALGNWWGDASGPSGNGQGIGDAVSEYVDFADWLSEEVDILITPGSDTIYVPQQESDTINLYIQNWKNRNDEIQITAKDEFGWLTGQAFSALLTDSLPSIVLLPVLSNMVSGSDEVEVSAISLNNFDYVDTSKFILIAQERTPKTLLLGPDTAYLDPGDTLQFLYYAFDQFDDEILINPVWETNGGTIDDEGIFVAGQAEGTFTLKLADDADRVQNISTIIIGDQTTSIEEVLNPGNDPLLSIILVYPNPFDQNLNILLKSAKSTFIDIHILDALGHTVASMKAVPVIGNTEVVIPIVNLPENKGIYFLQVRSEDGTSDKVLVKL